MLLRHDKEYEINTSDRRPFFHSDNYLKIDNTNLPNKEMAKVKARMKEQRQAELLNNLMKTDPDAAVKVMTGRKR